MMDRGNATQKRLMDERKAFEEKMTRIKNGNATFRRS